MKVKAGLVIDLGNSETRARTILDNKTISVDELSNRYVPLESGYQIPLEYQNKGTTILKHGSTFYASGEIAEREFSNKLTRPSSIERKINQVTTELSIKMSIYTSIIRISEALAKPIKELEITYDISILLPPLEHDVDKSAMRDLVNKQTDIQVIVPKPMQVEKTVTIASVQVQPEGVAAFFAVCFEETADGMVDRPENIEYLTDTTLIVDIGAGTTELAQMLNGELVENSKETLPIGGNTVESVLKRDIRRQYSFAPADMKEVISTGLLTEGTTQHDIVPLLDKSKRAYAETAQSNIREYVESMSINMREIKGILVVGGGSKPTVRDGEVVSPPMSEILLEYLQKLAPNMKLVDTLGIDPRLLNITGLEYIHKYT